jgi:predicted Zn-dependent peptidase
VDDYVDRIREVTAEDVQRVARTYFDNNKLTVATLWPEVKTDAESEAHE